MEHTRFETNISLRENMNIIDTFLVSNHSRHIPWEQLIKVFECPNQECIGITITEKGITLLIE